MKRCPGCGREYDNTMSFCLDDGAELLYGPASMNEPATAILSEPPALAGGQFASEARTRDQVHTTEKTANLPSHVADPPKAKVLDKRLLFAPVIVAVIVLGGFFGYRYFASGGQQIESIAVMPFVNESGNADVEYLSDGMTETLITSLSNIPNLAVKARSTVFYYKGKEASPKTIGEELDVQAVLLGRVSQRGDELKLSLELVNTQTQDAIWSEQYNRRKSDLVSLQSEIARDVSNKLRTKLSGAEVAKITKTQTADPRAYEFYLKGKYHASQFTREGLYLGIDYFNQAIAIDPGYGTAYSGLAYNYILLDDWFMSPNESVALARQNAVKAAEIDDTDADAHVVLALVAHWYDWNWEKAEQEFKRALELDPKHSDAHVFYSYFLAPMGRHDEALAMARQGLQLDPLSSLANFSVASALLFNRRWDDTIAHLEKAIEIDPNYWFHHSYLGRAYLQKGMMPQALAAFQRGINVDREQSENWAGLAHGYAAAGRKAEAQKIVDDLVNKSTGISYVSPYNIAVIYSGLKDHEKAFTWLERAYTERSYYLPVYLTTDARLDNLRTDPRFDDLVRRMGLPLEKRG